MMGLTAKSRVEKKISLVRRYATETLQNKAQKRKI